jgi:outer membrane immunogenic protein
MRRPRSGGISRASDRDVLATKAENLRATRHMHRFQLPDRAVLRHDHSTAGISGLDHMGGLRMKTKLKRLLAGVALTALGGGPTLAADLPFKARPTAPAPAPWAWTGFYVGAQIGWAHIDDGQTLASPTFALPVNSSGSGVVGGGHVGFNYQVNRFVLGIENDVEGNSINTTYPIGAPFVATTGTARLDWQVSMRGRVGVAFDRVLVYGTGGVAFGHFIDTYCTSAAGSCVFFDSVPSVRAGWTAGAGLEYAFWDRLSARLEYRYTDFGTQTNTLAHFLAPSGVSNDRVTEQAVRFGASYRFSR